VVGAAAIGQAVVASVILRQVRSASEGAARTSEESARGGSVSVIERAAAARLLAAFRLQV
jgi:hypothetical protein